MKPIFAVIALYAAEILLSPKKEKRYENLEAVFVSGIFSFLSALCVIITTVTNVYSQTVLWILTALQAVAIISCKLLVKSRNSKSRYPIPTEYSERYGRPFVYAFYTNNDAGPGLVVKGPLSFLSLSAFIAASALYIFFAVQGYFPTAFSGIDSPEAGISLISFLIEVGIFLSGPSALSESISRYLSRSFCRNKRELAAAKHSYLDDYSRLFKDNFSSEYPHIIRATKQNYLPEKPVYSISFYDFKTKTNHSYKVTQTNIALENFIKENGLKVNELFCAAYTLLDENQNVLLKTPSYVDFEPYLAAIIKQRVAQTEKIVLIVNSVENQKRLSSEICNTFTEYFGFQAVPVFKTIGEWFSDVNSRKDKQKETKSFFSFIDTENYGEEDAVLPVKEPDIIIASPDDICDPLYTELIRSMTSRLGLIVYYDFNDCVQEEPLYAKTIHSIIDSDDSVSTLYMTDGFFDFEQALDNFFSTRTIYQITVPREVPETSYDMIWKSENMQNIQAREITDASRNFGSHIALVYYALGFIRNDALVVADEHDAYAENLLNYEDEKISNRMDYHIGWKNVIGGNSVYCTVSDTYNNIAHTYLSMRGIGSKSEYINIISRPYLLRRYIAYNLKYFSNEPRVLTSFSSGIIKTPRAIATQAIAQSYILGCKKEKLIEYANALKLDKTLPPKEILCEIASIANDGAIDVAVFYNEQKDERYRIDESSYVTIMDKSEFITKMNFHVNGEVIRRPYRDYKYLIPQQKIVLNGIKYTVLSIDGNNVTLTDSNNRDPIYPTRTVRTCKAHVKSVENYEKTYFHGNNSYINFSHIICDAEVDVLGRISFTDSYSLSGDKAQYNFNEISRIRTQVYRNTNVFKVRIGNALINEFNREKLAHMMALLFNEMLPTFFPKHSDKIILSCTGWNIDPCLEGENITLKHIVAPMDIDDPEPAESNEICMYIMEDSSIETGIVNVFWQDEEFKHMIQILEDYLYHIEYVDRNEADVTFGKSHKETLHTLRKILLLTINEHFDADLSADSSLERISLNPLRVKRNKFYSLDLTNKYKMYCDFCGKEIPARTGKKVTYQFYHYSGIVSCTDCFSKAVCSRKNDVNSIRHYEALIDKWLTDNYKITAREVPFYNYLEDAEFIAKLADFANKYIVTDDAFDHAVAGISCSGFPYNQNYSGRNPEYIACTHMDGSYSHMDIERTSYKVDDRGYRAIFIADGFPEDRYKCTLCHEMTHQWQHTHTSPYLMKRNAPSGYTDEFGNTISMDNFRYEGHAVWTAVEYAKKNVGRSYAKKMAKEFLNRNDVYGFGYKWILELMKYGNIDEYSPVEIHTKEFMRKLRKFQRKKNSFGVMELYYGNSDSDTDSYLSDGDDSSDSDEIENIGDIDGGDDFDSTLTDTDDTADDIADAVDTSSGSDDGLINEIKIPSADDENQ